MIIIFIYRDSIHALVAEQSSGSEQPRKRRAINQDELRRIASEVSQNQQMPVLEFNVLSFPQQNTCWKLLDLGGDHIRL